MDFFIDLIFYGTLLTYIVCGFIFSFESLLAMNGAKSACQWIKKWYSPEVFAMELVIFMPMLHITYVFLEVIPYIFGINDELESFDTDTLLKNIYENKERCGC